MDGLQRRGPSALLALAALIAAAPQCQQELLFVEVTGVAGLSAAGPTYGAAWGDYDGDGRPDLWVGNHGQALSLYRNDGDGTFTDVGNQVLVDRGDAHGPAWADFDNDGDQDLIEVVGAAGGTGSDPNHFLLNAAGILVDAAPALGLDHPLGRSRTPLWWDWNGDGRLDVVIASAWRSEAPTDLFEQQLAGFQPLGFLPGLQGVRSDEFAQLSDLSGNGRPELVVHGWPNPNRIYDTSSVPFEDVTGALGVTNTKGVEDAVVADLDGDARPDLFLLHSFGAAPDLIQDGPSVVKAVIAGAESEEGIEFATTGDVSFRGPQRGSWSKSEVYIGASGWQPPSLLFTLSSGDPATHGIYSHQPGVDRGVYIGYDPGRAAWQLWVTAAGRPQFGVIIESIDPITGVAALGWTPVSEPAPTLDNKLYLQRDGQLVDETSASGFAGDPGLCESVVAGDFDNDMDLDLFMTCIGGIANLPNRLYENRGDGSFARASNAGGAAGPAGGNAGAVVTADYDGDGFLDLFVCNGSGGAPFNDGPHQLFRNVGNGNRWLEIDLEGVISNRDGIGTVVRATTPDGRVQLREQGGGMHNTAQDHSRLHLGLGGNESVDDLEIRWPSGVVQHVSGVPANQLLHVIEPSSPSLRGRPDYTPGVDAGVFLWQETFDGPHQLRISGSGPPNQGFTVRLVSDADLLEAVTSGLNGSDTWLPGPSGFALLSRVSVGEDSVDFRLRPGARALLSVENDGLRNPRLLHVGAGGEPLSPAGWVLPAAALPAAPGFAPGEDLGLFVGSGAAPDGVEARWSGDGRSHAAVFELLVGTPLGDVGLVDVEGDEGLVQTPSSVRVEGAVAGDADGVDVRVDPSADVGFAYLQDGLLPPHRVNPDAGRLGFPNAYWLPRAEPFGAPGVDAGQDDGLFLWLEGGTWHLRAVAASGSARFVGILVAGAAGSAAGVGLEGDDFFYFGELRMVVAFDLQVDPGDEDGIDFAFPAGAAIALDLAPASSALAEAVRVGAERWPVGALPVALGGW